MELLSSRFFLLLLLSTYRIQSSIIARGSNVSNPAGNQQFDITKFIESSTGSISDQTPRTSHVTSSEQSQTLSNHGKLDNATNPETGTWTTTPKSWNLTTQPVTTANSRTSTMSIYSSINISITEFTPATGAREPTTDRTTTGNDSTDLQETRRGDELLIQVSTAIIMGSLDLMTINSTTDDNLIDEHSNTTLYSTTTVELMTLRSESDDAGKITESTDDFQSEEENGMNMSWVAAFLVVTFGTISLVLNVLNIVIYSQRTAPSRAYIIMLNIVDILDALLYVFIMTTTMAALDISGNRWFYLFSVNFRSFMKHLSYSFNALISADRFFVIYKIWKTRNHFQEYPKTVAGVVAFFLLVCIALRAYTVKPSIVRPSKSSFILCHGVDQVHSNMTTMDALKLNMSLNQNTEVSSALEMTTPGVTSAIESLNIVNTIALFFNMIFPYLVFLTIAVFNKATLVSLRRKAEERKRLNVATTTRDSHVQERKQTVILLTMTTVYILLSLPQTLIMTITTFKFYNGDRTCWSSVLLNLALVSGLVTNSSDFLVFVVVSRSFRERLVMLFARRKGNSTHTK